MRQMEVEGCFRLRDQHGSTSMHEAFRKSNWVSRAGWGALVRNVSEVRLQRFVGGAQHLEGFENFRWHFPGGF